jgi:hypothetical protein
VRIPLRPGVWIVMAETRAVGPTTSTVNTFLGQVSDGRLIEAVDVLSIANASRNKERYGAMTFAANDLYRAVESNEADGSQAGWFVRNTITWPWRTPNDKTTGIGDLNAAAATWLLENDIAFPPELLLVRFVRREQSKTLQVGYYVNPASHDTPFSEHELPSWRESDFAPLNIRRHPDKFAFFMKTVDWATQWWPDLKSSFQRFHPEGF